MSDYSDDDYFDEDMLDGTQDYDTEDDMAMSIYNDDFRVSTEPKRKAYDVDYESLSKSAVEEMMRKEILECTDMLGIEAGVSALLLRYLAWNKERLIEKYMDNPSAVLIGAGVQAKEEQSSPGPDRTRHASPQPSSSRRSTRSTSNTFSSLSPTSSSSRTARSPVSTKSSNGPFVCPICFDDDSDLRPLSLVCGHQFCSNCWEAYASSKVLDEAEHAIQCMAEGCGIVAPDSFVRDVLGSNAQAYKRFDELLMRHFVASNPSLKYCPYPGCTNTVSCPSASSKSALTSIVPTVSCGARGVIVDGHEIKPASTSSSALAGKEHKFCFGCPIDGDHRPVICSVARMWLKKCQDDSETANWIKSNTKECSHCQSTIEKNGGCNHMTCKKCKYEFCWVCMGPWSEHGTAWYSCNRYDEQTGVDARDAQSRSRASLERYLHYYNRWANHEQSAKLSLDVYAKTEKKMEDMQITSALTWIEVQFMKKAVEEVDKCRQTLKWTYAMAYYLAKSNQKDLFEDNQRDLERAVEELSELIEQPLEAENIPTLRQKVTDKTVYVAKRNEIMLEDTANGFLDGRWRWNMTVEGFDEPEPGEIAV